MRKVKLIDESAQLFGINPPAGRNQAGSDFDDEAHL